jgi:hypothetical protein
MFERLSLFRHGVSVPVCGLCRGLRCRRWQRLGVLRPSCRVCVWRRLQQFRTLQREEPLLCKGFRDTPGGTRTPNLLIRKSKQPSRNPYWAVMRGIWRGSRRLRTCRWAMTSSPATPGNKYGAGFRCPHHISNHGALCAVAIAVGRRTSRARRYRRGPQDTGGSQDRRCHLG